MQHSRLALSPAQKEISEAQVKAKTFVKVNCFNVASPVDGLSGIKELELAQRKAFSSGNIQKQDPPSRVFHRARGIT